METARDSSRAPDPRPARTTLLPDRPAIMGIVNVTPDSFFDGGHHATAPAAVAHARRLIVEGADIVDVGGESTRPGSRPVDADEEHARVVPVVAALHAELETTRGDGPHIPISVDTTKASVAAAALDAGAAIVNDVSAGRFDERMFPLVAERGAAIVLMHMQGTPATMQQAPAYHDVVAEVAAFLGDRAAAARAAGIAPNRILIDPGIGFGKRLEHNLALLAHLDRLVALGYPVVVGASRKGFLGTITGDATDDRLIASVAVAVLAVAAGARVVRVHDVAATRRGLLVAAAVAGARARG